MRHGNKVNHLSRKKGHHTALLKNLANALITHKRINTTLAKAKVLRTFIEPLLTKAKDNTTHSRRVVFSYLQNKDTVTELFGTIAAKIATRPGGYTRIIKLGFRKGDDAEVAMIELVDFNEVMLAGKEEAANAKRRRTRRGGVKKAATTETTTTETTENSEA
jgi:large subunit ribosomal protein L17